MWQQITHYLTTNGSTYLLTVRAHMEISFLALAVAIGIGIPCGYLCARYRLLERPIVSTFQILRIIPSLAILFLLIPIMGIGKVPALVALTLLAIPPILMNTVTGLQAVPDVLVETAVGLGMTENGVWSSVRFPLGMPLILNGIKLAMVETIASATLAAKIGAGGLGELIFTGLGLNRMDLLLVGGLSVAGLSIMAGLLLDIADRGLLRYRYASERR